MTAGGECARLRFIDVHSANVAYMLVICSLADPLKCMVTYMGHQLAGAPAAVLVLGDGHELADHLLQVLEPVVVALLVVHAPHAIVREPVPSVLVVRPRSSVHVTIVHAPPCRVPYVRISTVGGLTVSYSNTTNKMRQT